MASTIEAPLKVYKNIRSYFTDSNGLKNYDLISVRQKLTEDYLYRVMAKNRITNKYTVWTCWNEDTQSLNFGHYNLNLEDAMDIYIAKESGIFD